MARVNYSGEKRRKELEKQRKKEEKKQRKLAHTAGNSGDAPDETEGAAADADASEETETASPSNESSAP